ncbi:hypothetical protein V866_003073 [Kwoniella sp. B9012]
MFMFYYYGIISVLGLFATVSGLTEASPIALPDTPAKSHIEKRGDHPLWDVSPKWQDIKKDKFDNEWFLVAAATLVNWDSQKIKDRISAMQTSKKRADNVDVVTVELWNKEGAKWEKRDVKYSSITADYSGSNQYWWIAALEDAAMRIGGLGGKGIDKDGFTDGDSHFAYQMLTGEEADLYETDRDAKTYKNEIWKVLEKATESSVCIKTGPNPDKNDGLRKNTWYGILRAEGLSFDDEGNEIGEGQVYLFDAKEGKEFYLGFEHIQDDIAWYSKPKYLMPDPDVDPSISAP